MSPPLRILVADDHSLVRAGLRALLATVDDIELVAEAATGNEAVALTDRLTPDVVLMDLQMPDGDGIEATRTIAASRPDVAILVLTMFEDDDTIVAALRAGARGYLLKGAEQQDVVRSIVAVAAGHMVVGPGAADSLLARLSNPGPAPQLFPELTDRERDVLRHMAEGHNNRTIARNLHLSPKTVANHVSNILTKMQFTDRADAIVRARRAGLVDDRHQPSHDG